MTLCIGPRTEGMNRTPDASNRQYGVIYPPLCAFTLFLRITTCETDRQTDGHTPDRCFTHTAIEVAMQRMSTTIILVGWLLRGWEQAVSVFYLVWLVYRRSVALQRPHWRHGWRHESRDPSGATRQGPCTHLKTCMLGAMVERQTVPTQRSEPCTAVCRRRDCCPFASDPSWVWQFV